MLITQSTSELESFLSGYSNPKTRTPYEAGLRRFYLFLSEKNIQSLELVDKDVLEAFKKDLELDFAPKTCQMTMGHVKCFMRFLKARGKITRDESILVTGTKVNSREQKTFYLTEAEAQRLVRVVYKMDDNETTSSLKLMVLLLLNAGLRQDELVNLKFKDMTIQDGRYVLKILGKGMRFRYITLSQQVTSEVSKVISTMSHTSIDDYVIQGSNTGGNYDHNYPMNPTSILRRIKKLSDLANIDKEISPHSLRRTCATLMYKRGVPIEVIQRILGHDKVTTTHRYLDMEIDIQVSRDHSLDIA